MKVTIGAAIFVGHAGLSMLAYLGRCRGLSFCEPDWLVFGLPYLAAVVAYAALFTGAWHNAKKWRRIALAVFAALWCAAGSALAGMWVAFTWMGT
jgi:hypothetical protein